MNQFSNNSLINYRILKTPLETLRPNEHKMTIIEYQYIRKLLTKNLSKILDGLDEYIIHGNMYIDRDHRLRCIVIDTYKRTYEDIHNAFITGKIVCSNKIIGGLNK